MFRASYLNGLGLVPDEGGACPDGSSLDPVGQVCCPIGSLWSTVTRQCECTDPRKRMNAAGNECVCAAPGFLGQQGAGCDCPPGQIWQALSPDSVAEGCVSIPTSPTPTIVQVDPTTPVAMVMGHVGFVRQLYLDLLGYEPDPQSLAWWISILEQGASREDVRDAFMSGSEYQGNALPATQQTVPPPGVVDDTAVPYDPTSPPPLAPRPVYTMMPPEPWPAYRPRPLGRRSLIKVGLLGAAIGLLVAAIAR